MIQITVEKGICQAQMRGKADQCLTEAVLAVNRLYVNLKREAPEFGELFKEAVERGLPWREAIAEASVEISIPGTGRREN